MYNQFYNPYAPAYQMQQPDMNQYRPQIQPQTMVGAQMSSPNQDERIWVQGEEAAKAYLVIPNGFVRLWDSTRPVFYEKRADASGKPSIVAYEYHTNATQPPNSEEKENSGNKYDEKINNIYERLNALEERMSDYEQTESYDDDPGVSEIPERIPRKSTARSGKTDQRG